ncbi:probable bud23-protein involved in bud-site selection [Phaffia rhodozyma]|uniref:Probable bud23-protein involved in bud-site selection n=1 Tax=Phaffia rhodozyma TaxID=264483 RepID=A0A0F7SSH3_PHARH|nr:probable bud23-protein involved in bud-site selection [Phaffia rhodozyma]
MSRPEHISPPEIYYGDIEATKYTQNTRIQTIQASMTHRAIELLALPEGSSPLILDIGCGSGLSGEILDENGFEWVGVDVAPSMLEVALEREVQGDLFLQDIGQGFGYRPGSFDGAISISVLQWLFNADATCHNPAQRLSRFFTTLHSALSRGSRAVLQFYPESDNQVHMALSTAMKSGFGGGLVIDYPNSRKAKKFYLCLIVGGSPLQAGNGPSVRVELPKGLEGEGDDGEGAVRNEKRREKGRTKRRKGKMVENDRIKGTREWTIRKKEGDRKKGKEHVPTDSKYTARKRKIRF